MKSKTKEEKIEPGKIKMNLEMNGTVAVNCDSVGS
jgi:hypothetical protein